MPDALVALRRPFMEALLCVATKYKIVVQSNANSGVLCCDNYYWNVMWYHCKAHQHYVLQIAEEMNSTENSHANINGRK